MRQRPADDAHIALCQPVERSLEPVQHAPQRATVPVAMLVRVRPDGRQHRVQREADQHGNQHGDRYGEAELVKELADDAAHEAYRQKHRHHGKGGGQHCQADFISAIQRRLYMVLAQLAMTHDVFPHHDGVVNQQADGQGQGHQRHQVEGEAQRLQGKQSAHQRHRQGEAGNHRTAPAAQKQEYDQHRQRRAFQQGGFHIGQRLFHLGGLVVGEVHLGAGRHAALHGIDHLLHAIGHFHHIGPARRPDIDTHPGFAINQGRAAGFGFRVADTGDIRQPDGAAIAVTGDQAGKVFRRLELATDPHIQLVAGTTDRPGREVAVTGADGIGHFLQGQAAGLQPVRVDINADLPP